MQLTIRQVRQPRMSRACRDKPPTVLWYVRRSWRAYLLLGCVCGGGIAFFLWGGWPIASGFFAGFLLAAVARDLRWYSQFVQSWPLSNEITNWNRVDELLRSSSESAP